MADISTNFKERPVITTVVVLAILAAIIWILKKIFSTPELPSSTGNNTFNPIYIPGQNKVVQTNPNTPMTGAVAFGTNIHQIPPVTNPSAITNPSPCKGDYNKDVFLRYGVCMPNMGLLENIAVGSQSQADVIAGQICQFNTLVKNNPNTDNTAINKLISQYTVALNNAGYMVQSKISADGTVTCTATKLAWNNRIRQVVYQPVNIPSILPLPGTTPTNGPVTMGSY